MASVSFEDYKPMILDFAYKYSRKYHLEQDDVISQGYLIFVEAAKKFDETRAKFSTYLWSRLFFYLSTYCSEQCYYSSKSIFETEEEFDYWLEDEIRTCPDLDLDKEFNVKLLSDEAKQVLQYIIYRDWEVPGKSRSKPSYGTVENEFVKRGWRKRDVFKSWNELRSWWREVA